MQILHGYIYPVADQPVRENLSANRRYAVAKQKVDGAVIAKVQAKLDQFADPVLASAGCAGLKLPCKLGRPPTVKACIEPEGAARAARHKKPEDI